MNSEELMNLGKTAAVLVGSVPAMSLFGKGIGDVKTAVDGISGIATDALSGLGNFREDLKCCKSATDFKKDFGGSLKGLGSAITGPFQVLTPKLSSSVGKIGGIVSSVPGK